MKIALVGDAHYSSLFQVKEEARYTELENLREDFYQQYFEDFFNLEADIYISVGDLTNIGHPKEYEGVYNIINSFDKPFYQVLGNHDLYISSRTEAMEAANMVQERVLDFEDVSIYFLETARERDVNNYSGYVSDEQLAHLEDFLIKSGAKPVIVVGHHPVSETTFGSNVPMWRMDPKIKFQETLEKKTEGSAFYICGHNHSDSIVKIKNWEYLQLGAVLDYPSARVLEVDVEEAEVVDYPMNDSFMAAAALELGKNMPHYNHWHEAIGTYPFRNRVFYGRER